jgi:hypothetical protein
MDSFTHLKQPDQNEIFPHNGFIYDILTRDSTVGTKSYWKAIEKLVWRRINNVFAKMLKTFDGWVVKIQRDGSAI